MPTASFKRQEREMLPPSPAQQSETRLGKICDRIWNTTVQQEKPLTTYPTYLLKSKLNTNGLPRFKDYQTISRHLFAGADQGNRCPYGDEPASIADLEAISQPTVIQDAYTLSALRFYLNPFQDTISRPGNKFLGIPEQLQNLYRELRTAKPQVLEFQCSQFTSSLAVREAVAESQQQMRYRFVNELEPFINANPFNPMLHEQELSPIMMHDLKQYVQLQNSPHTFFDLMQGLERDVAIHHWRSLHLDPSTSIENSLVHTMASWCDEGHRRKRPIKCPIGVPLSYMQAMRRKGQPCINQEFAGQAHGALNHWLQEHIWQRFCNRYPNQCILPPNTFFKQIGHLHIAFADAIYELHMDNVVNPANTNFWSILQFYLPWISPWS